MKESYKDGDSDSILALSLAGDIARCCFCQLFFGPAL
jgi:hypothetical protein